jgi:hypothetical protein
MASFSGNDFHICIDKTGRLEESRGDNFICLLPTQNSHKANEKEYRKSGPVAPVLEPAIDPCSVTDNDNKGDNFAPWIFQREYKDDDDKYPGNHENRECHWMNTEQSATQWADLAAGFEGAGPVYRRLEDECRSPICQGDDDRRKDKPERCLTSLSHDESML